MVSGAGALHDEAVYLEQEWVMFAFSQCLGATQNALCVVNAHKTVREDGDVFACRVTRIRGMH